MKRRSWGTEKENWSAKPGNRRGAYSFLSECFDEWLNYILLGDINNSALRNPFWSIHLVLFWFAHRKGAPRPVLKKATSKSASFRLLRESRSYRDDVDGKSAPPLKVRLTWKSKEKSLSKVWPPSLFFQVQENGVERSLGNGHMGLDNSRTLIMSARERDIGLHETDF